ncbi:hypothetical protein KEM52_003832, partial [Ascosphaera acerosa]
MDSYGGSGLGFRLSSPRYRDRRDRDDDDAVLRLVQARAARGGSISPTLWFHVLDRASAAMHEPCVELCWRERVGPGLLNPPAGVCDQVLRTTARTGNVALAQRVFRLLRARGSARSVDNYEALIDTYLAAGDLRNALRVLCRLAATSSVALPASSTRALLSHIISRNEPPEALWRLLRELAREASVPPVAANLV